MTRTFAFFAAVLLTTVTVTSSCFANSPNDLRFKLQGSEVRGDQVTLVAFSDRVLRTVRVRSGGRGAGLAYAALFDVDAQLAEPAYDLALLRTAHRPPG